LRLAGSENDKYDAKPDNKAKTDQQLSRNVTAPLSHQWVATIGADARLR
jgi:hypothetical protein